MLLSDLGNLFEKRRDFTKAIEMYRKAIETDPSHAWCYVELAELYRDLGDRELARKAYKQAMESSDFSTEFKRILEQRSTALEMNAAE
ncbi:MAG TPA: tetratricopeptide repeat protein [Acidobacteriota bacterium]|nr:tetratricopeptide repeat protein [Acidobacteriota bacterium]